MMHAAAKGTAPVLIIPLMLPKMPVFVMSATRRALVDTGEHLSPKKMPERMAPPVRAGLMPRALPMVMHITPIVATLPNDVPVRKDIKEFMRNAAMRNHEGLTIPKA